MIPEMVNSFALYVTGCLVYFAVLPIASPITRSLPTISVCIKAGSETGSKVSVGVGLAEGDGVSLGEATLLADSLALEQPANKSEPIINRGIKLRFILLKISDFQGIRRLSLNIMSGKNLAQYHAKFSHNWERLTGFEPASSP